MTRKQQKEIGIKINGRLRVCSKNHGGCLIYIKEGDLYFPEYGMGGWNVIWRKTCLNCFVKESKN